MLIYFTEKYQITVEIWTLEILEILGDFHGHIFFSICDWKRQTAKTFDLINYFKQYEAAKSSCFSKIAGDLTWKQVFSSQIALCRNMLERYCLLQGCNLELGDYFIHSY